MIKVGVRGGEVVLRVEDERDHRILMAMVDPGQLIVRVRGEDVTDELRVLYEDLAGVEWA